MHKSSGELEVEHSADNSWAFLDAACLRMCFSLSTCQGDVCVRAGNMCVCMCVGEGGMCVCAVCGGGKHVIKERNTTNPSAITGANQCGITTPPRC